jgi:hypothetical protein
VLKSDVSVVLRSLWGQAMGRLSSPTASQGSDRPGAAPAPLSICPSLMLDSTGVLTPGDVESEVDCLSMYQVLRKCIRPIDIGAGSDPGPTWGLRLGHQSPACGPNVNHPVGKAEVIEMGCASSD